MLTTLRRTLGTLLACALWAAGPGVAVAQSVDGPIRVLVGFPAGGTIDAVARVLAEKMSADLGTTVIVENRAGAGGQIAAQHLRQAAPDGKTLMIAPDHTLVIIPLTMRNPGYDAAKDFSPIGQVARYVGAMAVAADTGVTDVKGFIAWAKANPQRANVGLPAPGSKGHFAMAALSKEIGTPLQTVPYRGSAPLVQDLLGGQVASGITALGDFLDHHAAGRMRIIGIADAQRSSLVPDIPTFEQQGHKMELDFWLALFGPAGMPPALVERLNKSLGQALAMPDVRERMQQLVFEPHPASPADVARLIEQGMKDWQAPIRDSGWVMP